MPATFTFVVAASLVPLPRLIPDSVPSFDALHKTTVHTVHV
jgi:hypothetical protein